MPETWVSRNYKNFGYCSDVLYPTLFLKSLSNIRITVVVNRYLRTPYLFGLSQHSKTPHGHYECILFENNDALGKIRNLHFWHMQIGAYFLGV